MTIDARTEQLLRRRLTELADQVDEPVLHTAFAPEVAPRRRRPRTSAFAVALTSAAAVIATAFVLSSDRPHQQAASTFELSDGPPLSPSRVPADLQLEIVDASWQPVQATRVQRYVQQHDPAVTVLLVVTAVPLPVSLRAPQSDVPMLGQIDPATMSWAPTANGGRLSAGAGGGVLSLKVVGLDEADARGVAAQFSARSADPLGGYDPAPNSGLRLTTDVLQDAGRVPVTSQEWRSQGTGRTLTITTNAATPATQQLFDLRDDVQSEATIGGRQVLRTPSGATFRDGDTIVSVSDWNLTDAELDAVIEALEPLSPSEWAQRRQAANDRLANAVLLTAATAPTSNGSGRHLTVELRQVEDAPVFCLTDSDTRSCARMQFASSASAAPKPDASDAASFAAIRHHEQVWIVGTVGPDVEDNVTIELGDNTIEPDASTDPDGRRWYAWKIDHDRLDDGLPYIYLDGALGGGAGHLALPR